MAALQQTENIVARRKDRWKRLYDRSAPPTSLFLIRVEDAFPERPWPNPDSMDARVEWAWEKYQRQIEQMQWLDDDTLPFLDLYTGTEIFAAAFGCPVYYPENDMPFALPCILDAQEVEGIQPPGLGADPIASLFSAAETLRGRAEGALLHMIDLQTPMDIAALIWDKTQFYPAMIQSPEAVQSLAGKVQRYMTEVLDEWFARFGREFIAHYPDYYMDGGITLSADEVGAVSARMFRHFFLPEINELSARYGGLGLHCCANARHQWSGFAQAEGLRLLNLVQPEEVVREAVGFFEEKCAQWHSENGGGPPWTWPAQHSAGARMVYEIFAGSREEAVELSARMRAALGRRPED